MLPGDCRDFDKLEEIFENEDFSANHVPDDPPLSFEIEISDEPMPQSYWLTINDRFIKKVNALNCKKLKVNFKIIFSSENYILLRDVTSRGVNSSTLKPIVISLEEFR